MAEALLTRLVGRNIETIFDEGLHGFVGGVLHNTAALAQQIEVDYRFT